MRGTHLKGARPTHISNGCSLHYDCFTCPYPDCIVGRKDVMRNLEARAEAQRLKKDGYSTEQIAERLGQQIRSIQRWLQK